MPTVNVWQHYAWRRRTATAKDCWINGATAGTNPQSVTGRVFLNRFMVGTMHTGPDPMAVIASGGLSGRMAYLKVWTTNLTDAEMLVESKYACPISD